MKMDSGKRRRFLARIAALPLMGEGGGQVPQAHRRGEDRGV